ncbi:VanZ family protein [Erysipelothrix rhusiopathiae]|uniref:VanZ-like protein n=2 Tax=Erysipelothrix rhusiopathiae TaxID=1648 RepID=E7FVV8_ERYRH|nr:VanZ family protein [Erysipelothrix rhusiopathiae]EFY09028.1 VanZ-like protein [Erysipelothrix rhusiopathiae ATCC 19414]MDE8227797.1 VanZ family protein [Erysipelothrix rhusiopathiae]MDE8340118.1 VanZ family protein [Erysipelothrix rhusiopathiae]MDE8341540.1 VanZ family protein [Erysipelothrix rhusiopathiae]
MSTWLDAIRNGPVQLNTGIYLYIALFVVCYFTYFRKQERNESAINILLFIYFCGVFEVALLPIPMNDKQILANQALKFGLNYNTQPFFIDLFVSQYSSYMDYLIPNIVMLVPFGFLMNYKLKKPSFLKIVLLSMTFSLCIEMTQLMMQLTLYTRRVADINDLLSNTFGGMLGWSLYMLCAPAIEKIFALIPERRSHNI